MSRWLFLLDQEILENIPCVTDKTADTPTKEVLSVLTVPIRGISKKSLWQIDGHPVTVAPAADQDEMKAIYPAAKNIEPAPAHEEGKISASCLSCHHASNYSNSGLPVAAGLSTRFALIPHAAGGIGCLKFERRLSGEQSELMLRLEALIPRFYDDLDATILARTIRKHNDLSAIAELLTQAEYAVCGRR